MGRCFVSQRKNSVGGFTLTAVNGADPAIVKVLFAAQSDLIRLTVCAGDLGCAVREDVIQDERLPVADASLAVVLGPAQMITCCHRQRLYLIHRFLRAMGWIELKNLPLWRLQRQLVTVRVLGKHGVLLMFAQPLFSVVLMRN